MRRATLLTIFLALLALGGAATAAVYLFDLGGVSAPPNRVPEISVRLEKQNWTDAVAKEYHRTSQGTRILPLTWFLALEQPLAVPFPRPKLAARDYLSRFGFFYDSAPQSGKPTALNPDLPIGFAIEKEFEAPYADPPFPQKTQVVGLTCAACHTGRLDIALPRGAGFKGVLIEGGSAMINLSLFQKAVGQALFFTLTFDARFARFAADVDRFEEQLGTNRTPPPGAKSRKDQLRDELRRYVDLGLAGQTYAKEHKLYTTDAGFARTDALGLIGNRVFGVMDVENQIMTDAPVNFPHLWDTPWFDWVQYNASIRTPMARNIGEALGVGALINLTGKVGQLYDSTVNVKNLAWMEDTLGGDQPFAGLQPPSWDEMVLKVFGDNSQSIPSEYRVDHVKADRGKPVYEKYCQECHLPPRQQLEKELRVPDSKYFTKLDPRNSKRFLRVPVVDLNSIGTDPNQALNFYRRVAMSPEPVVKDDSRYESRWWNQGYPVDNPAGWNDFATISAAQGLFRITSFIRQMKYANLEWEYKGQKKKGLFAPPTVTDPKELEAYATERLKKDRYRFVPEPLELAEQTAIVKGDDIDWVIKANLGYKARPLDGIWATPPYFHNGSVPSLYQVLLPASGRAKSFYLGAARFDPKHVGYETKGFSGAFLMDTSLPGNSKKGHEFRNLTLEELEGLRATTSETPNSETKLTREQRWAALFSMGESELRTMPTDQRWQRIRDMTEKALHDPRPKPFKGVLGPELVDDDRWALVEYLKTL
jgi:hypothetical protein